MNKLDRSTCVLPEKPEVTQHHSKSQKEDKDVQFDISYTPYTSLQSDSEREYEVLKKKARIVVVTSVAVGTLVSLGYLIGKYI